MSITPLWNNTYVPVAATSLSLAADVYSLSTSNTVYQWDQLSALWSLTSPPVTFALINASAADGTETGVTTSGAVYRRAPSGTWAVETISILGATKVFAYSGDANHFVAIDSTGAIARVAYGSATALPSGPTQVAMGSLPTIMWGLDNSGNVYQWDETSFTWTIPFPGANLSKIQISDTDAMVGVNSAGSGWRYDGSWLQVLPPTGTSLGWLGQYQGDWWGITTGGDVFQAL